MAAKRPFRLHRLALLTTALTVAVGCTPQTKISKRTIEILNKTSSIAAKAAPTQVTKKSVTKAVSQPSQKSERAPAIARTQWVVKSGAIHRTFSQSARAAGIPANHIQHLQSLFGELINFRRDLHKGDRFSVIIKPDSSGSIKRGVILAAEMSSRGRPVRLIRHTDRQGVTRYHDGRGEPLGADFLRYPLKNAKVSSHFTLRRYHPVLKIYRPHRGTDFRAKKGTPVIATADGVVQKREHQHGYGNVIFLDHHGGSYSSVYAHLSRFSKWVKPGVPVRQGDVIGYVGSTGLSTGPHLHYELRKGEEYLDAMKVALPQKRKMSATDRRHFYQSTIALRRALLSQKSGRQLAMAR